jgi:transmembrane sensor
MPEPLRDLDAALGRVADRWDGARTERTLDGLHDKQRRRKRRAQVLWTGGAAITALAVFVALRGEPLGHSDTTKQAAAPVVAMQPLAASNALHLQLSDGSEVRLRDAQTQVRVDEVTHARVALDLQSGQARFDVQHREERTFRVRSGQVTVEVLGTSFELEREAARTRVLVFRGRVAVSWPGGRTELAAGEAGWFPRPVPGVTASGPGVTARGGTAPFAAEEHAEVPLSAARRGAKAAGRKPRVVSSPAADNTWRERAEQGDFEHAYELLASSGHPVADDVEELLLAADAARLSGHPDAALPLLRRVIDRHSNDARAPLAAFTLGGVLMQQLGEPREAEAAYARARALSLNKSLAEDALARQVEAAHRAGDAARARVLAREYLDQYPKGRRVHAVQRFGGLVD